ILKGLTIDHNIVVELDKDIKLEWLLKTFHTDITLNSSYTISTPQNYL
ncbi:21832_t:CDS:1, partial [Gigaspora margarita]